MAETIRIEIPIEVDDNTGPGTSSVEKNMNKVKDAADKVKSSTDNHFGAIAQLVEQRTENPCVPGSIPGGTTKVSFSL